VLSVGAHHGETRISCRQSASPQVAGAGQKIAETDWSMPQPGEWCQAETAETKPQRGRLDSSVLWVIIMVLYSLPTAVRTESLSKGERSWFDRLRRETSA
jgi:hypothetical protein